MITVVLKDGCVLKYDGAADVEVSGGFALLFTAYAQQSAGYQGYGEPARSLPSTRSVVAVLNLTDVQRVDVIEPVDVTPHKSE